MWVPHKELKKKRKIKKEEIERDGERRREKWEEEFFFLIFFLYYFHSQILKFPTVGFHRDKHGKVLYATRATREYQKHEISPRIQVNTRKIQIFSFSQIYAILVVCAFRTSR